MTQIAAETLGPAARGRDVQARRLVAAEAPVEGGSLTAASVGSAVKAACEKLREQLFELARQIDDSPLADADARRRRRSPTATSADAAIRPARHARRGDAARRGRRIEEEATAEPDDDQQTRYVALHALGGLRRGAGRRGPRHGPRHAGRQRGRRRAGSSTPRRRAARSWAASSGASAWRCTRRACSTTASAGS